MKIIIVASVEIPFEYDSPCCEENLGRGARRQSSEEDISSGHL